jgi:biotin carboxylase
MRILFLEDDGMTDLAPYVRALGHEPVVLRTGAYDSWHRDETQGLELEVNRMTPQASAMEMLDAAAAMQPDAVVSLALLDPHCWRDAIVGDFFRQIKGIPVLANPPSTVLIANDKLRTKNLLRGHGINVTEALAVENLADAVAAAEQLQFPLILKRNDGYSGMGMRLIENLAQLERFYQRQPSTLLAEHFTQGIELSVDVLRWGGQSRALSVIHKGETDPDLRKHPIYRLRVAPAPIAAAQVEQALAIACKAMDLLGIVGLAECEMILHPVHGPLVLEVNPRIAGTARLSAAATGLNLHCSLVDMVLGRCDLAHLPLQPQHAVQIPVRAKLSDADIARLEAMPAVRFIKTINWVPDLGVSASLTVAAASPPELLATLAEINSFAVLEPALSTLRALLGARF